MEEWRDISDYEGHYQVSSLGRVRSIKGTPIVLKEYDQANGYKQVCLWINGQKKNHLVHRLVAQAFLPNPLGLTDVNHLDEDKGNNNVYNLVWCSHRDNLNYGHAREKIGAGNRGKRISETTKRKLSIDTANRRWVNNGQTNRYIYTWEIDRFINDGWKTGRVAYWRI